MAPLDLHGVFDAYCAFGGHNGNGSGLDSKGLVKLCKEAGLIKGPLTTVDCDLLHTKYRMGKKISFESFEGPVINAIAAKKKCERGDVVEAIVRAGRPKSNGTKAESVRFFDDKSTFTGVHAHGGPSTVDGPKDLNSLCDRSPADKRGSKIPAKH